MEGEGPFLKDWEVDGPPWWWPAEWLGEYEAAVAEGFRYVHEAGQVASVGLSGLFWEWEGGGPVG